MKWFVLAVLCIAALPVSAQQIDQPVTLSAQEYNMIIGTLLQRDPVLATLVAKQREAQDVAKGKPSKTEALTPDKPAAP